MLKDESFKNVELALNVLCKKYPAMTREYMNRTRHLGNENDYFKLAWLKLSHGDKKALYIDVADMASESYEFRTRIKAMKILEEISYFDNNYMHSIVQGYLSFNRRLSRTAEKQLRVFLEDKGVGSTIGSYVANHMWNENEQKKLDKILIEYKRKIYK